MRCWVSKQVIKGAWSSFLKDFFGKYTKMKIILRYQKKRGPEKVIGRGQFKTAFGRWAGTTLTQSGCPGFHFVGQSETCDLGTLNATRFNKIKLKEIQMENLYHCVD